MYSDEMEEEIQDFLNFAKSIHSHEESLEYAQALEICYGDAGDEGDF